MLFSHTLMQPCLQKLCPLFMRTCFLQVCNIHTHADTHYIYLALLGLCIIWFGCCQKKPRWHSEARWKRDQTGVVIKRQELSRRSCTLDVRRMRNHSGFIMLESLYTWRVLAISCQLPAVVAWPSVHKHCISPTIRADNTSCSILLYAEWSDFPCAKPHILLCSFWPQQEWQFNWQTCWFNTCQGCCKRRGDQGGREGRMLGVKPASSPVNWASL